MTDDVAYHQFKLRIPEPLRERLESAANRSGRSLSAEIVFRLESTFPREIESELAHQRKAELMRLDTQIQYMTADLEHRRTQLRRAKLDPTSPDYAERLEAIVALEDRVRNLTALRDTVLQDLSRLLAGGASFSPT